MESHYLNTEFLKTETAKDLEDKLTAILNRYGIYEKIVQLSLDGPAVNKTLLKDFINHHKQVIRVHTIVDTGTCTIHPGHGSWQKAVKTLGVNIGKILACLHSLF